MTPAFAFSLALLLALGACATRTGPAPATSTPAPAAATDASLAALDALLVETWRKAGVTPAPLAGDGEFLRRVTLDLVGRPPRLEELRAFVADPAPDKRARAVDRLLADGGAGEHWADLEGDLLFGKERDKKIEKQNPRGYLATAFNENRPYDRLATELLTASGPLPDNPATAFLITRLRGGGGPEAAAGAAARIFLGLQIQCAQCHDHPYDPRWKQADFHGLAGYFARTRTRRAETMMMMEMEERAVDRSYALVDQKRGEAKMRAPGATADVPVAPKFLGRVLPVAEDTRRPTVAKAIVATDLFAKALVGRVWARLFGAAPFDPWDDLGAEGDPRHPPLLTLLADDFRASGFDLKRLMRHMVLSTAYQRSGAGAAGESDPATRLFARARVRPLSPEQLFRMVMVATGADEMVRARLRRKGVRDADGAAAPEDVVMRLAERTLREYRFAFDDDEMADTDFDGTLPQALLLFNGELTNNGARAAAGGTLATVLDAHRDPSARLEALFLATYARPPDAKEATFMREALAGVAAPTPRQGPRSPARKAERAVWEDVFFALLTSTEAVTNH